MIRKFITPHHAATGHWTLCGARASMSSEQVSENTVASCENGDAGSPGDLQKLFAQQAGKAGAWVKYLIAETQGGSIEVVLFGEMLAHIQMLPRGWKAQSAGYCVLREGEVDCYGASTSLGIGYLPSDKQLVAERLAGSTMPLRRIADSAALHGTTKKPSVIALVRNKVLNRKNW